MSGVLSHHQERGCDNENCGRDMNSVDEGRREVELLHYEVRLQNKVAVFLSLSQHSQKRGTQKTEQLQG
jgi:hypothetical protein